MFSLYFCRIRGIAKLYALFDKEKSFGNSGCRVSVFFWISPAQASDGKMLRKEYPTLYYGSAS